MKNNVTSLSKPILIHCHVWYSERWAEIHYLLSNVPPLPYELYISLPYERKELKDAILADRPEANILLFPNKGFDCYPFCSLLQQVNLSHYSYIIKLHTKRDMSAPWYDLQLGLWGGRMRRCLLSFMKKRHLTRAIRTMEQQPSLGMTADFRLIATQEPIDMRAKDRCRAAMEKLGFSPDICSFVMGNMFICRASLFECLKRLDFREEDFEPSFRHWGGYAHALERLFGSVIIAQGYTIEDVFTSHKKLLAFIEWFPYWFWRVYHACRRRLPFRKKST